MNAPVIALKALSSGKEVTLPDGATYVLIEEDGRYRLATKAVKLKVGGDPEDVLLAVDYANLDYFVNQANKLSDNDLIILAAETVLMENAKKRSKERKQ